MRLLTTSALVLTLGLQACGKPQNDSETKNVFGSDNRVALTATGYPWRAIGKVFGMGCTGTLVAANLVLTAAHCIIDPATKKPITTPISFRPNYINGNSADISGVDHAWWGTNDPVKFRGHDWAILRLTNRLGDKYGWLGVRPTTADNFPPQLSFAVYSSDFRSGNTAGVHHNCDTRKRFNNENLIFHDCDMTRGASGGPALRMFDDKLTIVGVNVAEFRNGGETSLHIPKYEDKHANVVIPTKELVAKIKEITGQ